MIDDDDDDYYYYYYYYYYYLSSKTCGHVVTGTSMIGMTFNII